MAGSTRYYAPEVLYCTDYTYGIDIWGLAVILYEICTLKWFKLLDFIDMEDPEHQRQVLRALEKAAEADPARTRIEGFSALGLVQMSRKRTRESLAQVMCAPCANCNGQGIVRTAESTCVEVLRTLAQDYQARCNQKGGKGDYLIRATEAVVDRLLDEDAEHLTALSQTMQREVRIQVEPNYLEGQFDIVLVQNVAR